MGGAAVDVGDLVTRRPSRYQPRDLVAVADRYDIHEEIPVSDRPPRSLVETVRRVAGGELLDVDREEPVDDLVWRQHWSDPVVLARGRRSPWGQES